MVLARGIRTVTLSSHDAGKYLESDIAVDGLVVGTKVGQLDGSSTHFAVEGQVICYPTGEVLWTAEIQCHILVKAEVVEAMRRTAVLAALDALHLAEGAPARPCRLALVMHHGDSCPDFYYSSSRDLGRSRCAGASV